MVAKLKAFWATLSPKLQAVLVGFGSAVIVTVLKNSASGDHILLCDNWHCVREHISTFLSSGATGALASWVDLNKKQPPIAPAA